MDSGYSGSVWEAETTSSEGAEVGMGTCRVREVSRRRDTLDIAATLAGYSSPAATG